MAICHDEKYLDVEVFCLNSGKGVHAWLLLNKAMKSIGAHAQLSIENLNMCGSDFAVLEVLLHKGALPVNVIGKRVLLTSGSISTAVERLFQRGYVERYDDPQDRRVRLIDLSKTGKRLIENAFKQHQKDMERALSTLSEDEVEQLIRLLRKAGQGADALYQEQTDFQRGTKND